VDVLRGIAKTLYNAQVRRRSTVLALFAILLPSVCFACGRDRYRIAGSLAAEYLTLPPALAVKDLLGYAHDEGGNDVKVGAEAHT
jgi:hypothetical protein